MKRTSEQKPMYLFVITHPRITHEFPNVVVYKQTHHTVLVILRPVPKKQFPDKVPLLPLLLHHTDVLRQILHPVHPQEHPYLLPVRIPRHDVRLPVLPLRHHRTPQLRIYPVRKPRPHHPTVTTLPTPPTTSRRRGQGTRPRFRAAQRPIEVDQEQTGTQRLDGGEGGLPVPPGEAAETLAVMRGVAHEAEVAMGAVRFVAESAVEDAGGGDVEEGVRFAAAPLRIHLESNDPWHSVHACSFFLIPVIATVGGLLPLPSLVPAPPPPSPVFVVVALRSNASTLVLLDPALGGQDSTSTLARMAGIKNVSSMRQTVYVPVSAYGGAAQVGVLPQLPPFLYFCLFLRTLGKTPHGIGLRPLILL